MSKKDQETDVAFIQALAEVLNEANLAEVRVKRDYGEDKTLDVRVIRSHPTPSAAAAPTLVAPTATAPIAAATTSANDPAPSSDPASIEGAVTSPMVGTTYLQPEPGAAAFISVGDQVKEGQTILIIEAMKTMNQIPAPKAGKITRIFIEDGTPVEFGTPLVVIE